MSNLNQKPVEPAPSQGLGARVKETIFSAGEFIAGTATEIKEAVVDLMQGNETDPSYQTPTIDAIIEKGLPVEDKPREQRDLSPVVGPETDKSGYVSLGSETLPPPPKIPTDPAQIKVNEAAEVLKARKADVDYSIDKAKLKDSNAPLGERISAIGSMVGDAVEGAKHRAAQDRLKKANEPTLTEKAKESLHNATEGVKKTINQVEEKISETASNAKEALASKTNEAKSGDSLPSTGERKADAGFNYAPPSSDKWSNIGSTAPSPLKVNEALKAKKADPRLKLHKVETSGVPTAGDQKADEGYYYTSSSDQISAGESTQHSGAKAYTKNI